MLIGYARVSTIEQNLNLQTDALQLVGCEKIFTDQVSGSVQNRPQLRMNEAESKAAETQVWLEYAAKCQYISKDAYTHLHYNYQEIIGKLINMGNRPEQWCLS